MLDEETERRKMGTQDSRKINYQDLKIYQRAHQMAIKIHRMSLDLPKHELYEMGSQIRRSSKSVCLNIVEGFGRRRYKNEFIQFLVYGLASCNETQEALELLFDAGSLKDQAIYQEFRLAYADLGKMMNSFIQSVEVQHQSKR